MVAKVTVFINQKGGVGKTTFAFNFAKDILKFDKEATQGKVLAIDNDPQGNLTLAASGITSSPPSNVIDLYKAECVEPIKINNSFHLIGSDQRLSDVEDQSFETVFSLADTLSVYKEKYDHIIIDTLPSFSKLQLAALIAADFAIIPFVPELFSAQGLIKVLKNIRRAQNRRYNPELKLLGIVFNRVKKTIVCQDHMRDIREAYKSLVFESCLKDCVDVTEAPILKESVLEYSKNKELISQLKSIYNEFLEKCTCDLSDNALIDSIVDLEGNETEAA